MDLSTNYMRSTYSTRRSALTSRSVNEDADFHSTYTLYDKAERNFDKRFRKVNQTLHKVVNGTVQDINYLMTTGNLSDNKQNILFLASSMESSLAECYETLMGHVRQFQSELQKILER